MGVAESAHWLANATGYCMFHTVAYKIAWYMFTERVLILFRFAFVGQACVWCTRGCAATRVMDEGISRVERFAACTPASGLGGTHHALTGPRSGLSKITECLA